MFHYLVVPALVFTSTKSLSTSNHGPPFLLGWTSPFSLLLAITAMVLAVFASHSTAHPANLSAQMAHLSTQTSRLISTNATTLTKFQLVNH